MATSGQTFNDRINAARYALAGQGLARCVCKATTEEVIGPKKKHLDYLIACTHEPNVSIPQLANLLIERTNHIYWVVVFKALVTVHHLMSYGNERFFQYIASSNYSFELSTFLDKTSARDFTMSTYIRRYSRYINEKALSYRLLAFDFCKVKRGNEGVLRVMSVERLLKTLPILQNQLDSLLEFDCSANDLNNGVINACFMLLFRDLIGLFACHSDGIINLLNKYFNLNKRMCREAFELYKKSLVRMDKVSEFLRVAETVGIDKDELPDLRKTPNSLIDALEQHLLNLESNKKILKQQQQKPQQHLSTTGGSQREKSNTELGVLGSLTPPSTRRPQSPASSSSGGAQNNFQGNEELPVSTSSFKDDEVKRALEEEARVLSQYGNESLKHKTSASPSGSSSSSSNNQPKQDLHGLEFSSTAITKPKNIDDIFGDPNSFTTFTQNLHQNGAQNNHSNNHHDNNSTSQSNIDVLSLDNGNSNINQSRIKQSAMVDFEALKTAVNKLEKPAGSASSKQANTNASTTSGKKASDDLFSLLSGPIQDNSNLHELTKGLSGATTTSTSSTFPSPFDLPLAANSKEQPTLRAGNPFPEVSLSTQNFAAPVSILNDPQNSLFSKPNSNPLAPLPISTVPTPATVPAPQMKPNYTNLGGFEGYGVLLQPMTTSGGNGKLGSAGGNNAQNFSSSLGMGGTPGAGNPNSSSSAQSKRAFDAPSGLVIKGDLDATLANLAQNLTFEGGKVASKSTNSNNNNIK